MTAASCRPVPTTQPVEIIVRGGAETTHAFGHFSASTFVVEGARFDRAPAAVEREALAVGRELALYVAGPIHGYEALNEPAFRAAAKVVEAAGHRAVVPHDIPPHAHEGGCPPGRLNPGNSHQDTCYLRACLKVLLDCDGIVLIRGWQASQGARAELSVATAAGIPVWLLIDGGLVRLP